LLIDYYRLDGAFVSRLQRRLFELGRDLFNLYLRYLRAHFKDLRAGVAAQAAGRAGILNSRFHTGFPIVRFQWFNSTYFISLETQYVQVKFMEIIVPVVILQPVE
jgi:hypothetical protein